MILLFFKIAEKSAQSQICWAFVDDASMCDRRTAQMVNYTEYHRNSANCE